MRINQPPPKQNYLLPWLNALAFIFWGIVLTKFWFTGKLRLLIHPNYFILVLVTGLIFLVVGSINLHKLVNKSHSADQERDNFQHITLFPPILSTGLLLITAIVALIIPPGVLGSDMAMRRGVSSTLPTTRLEPQSFRVSQNTEEKSIVDWVRTINTYPEPDNYRGQKVNVVGFVVYDNELGENYLLISRFVLTCCAVDAYPVGLPVKLDTSRKQYPPDTWLRVKGQMTVGEVANQRQVTINPNSIEKVATPADPYDY